MENGQPLNALYWSSQHFLSAWIESLHRMNKLDKEFKKKVRAKTEKVASREEVDEAINR